MHGSTLHIDTDNMHGSTLHIKILLVQWLRPVKFPLGPVTFKRDWPSGK